MIFKRKSRNVSSASIREPVDDKFSSKAETLYFGTMCFTAACLSFITLEVGTRSLLGKSATKSVTFNAIFRRSYNMKIKIMMTNVVTGLITTVMLALGDLYRVPYLHVPWLCNTLRGMILYEGPTLLGLTYVWLPNVGIPAGAFIFITFLLFAEEVCLWFDVLGSLKSCWNEYHESKAKISTGALLPTDGQERMRYTDEEKNNVEQAMAKSTLVIENSESIGDAENNIVIANSTYSYANSRLGSTKSSNETKSGDR